MSIKEKIFIVGKKYINFKIRSARGGSYTAELTVLLDNATRAGAITVLLKTYLNFLLPWWSFPLLYVVQKTIEYLIGSWDEEHGGLWRYENGYQSQRLNPWNQEVMEKLKNIESKL